METPSVRWITFVIRLWNDTTAGQWRGEIVRLPDRESCYFASWEQAGAFIRRFAPGLEWQSPTSDSPEEWQSPDNDTF